MLPVIKTSSVAAISIGFIASLSRAVVGPFFDQRFTYRFNSSGPLAQVALPLHVPVPTAQVVRNIPTVLPPGSAAPIELPPQSQPRPSAHFRWADLIARIFHKTCGSRLQIVVVTAAQILGKSDWQL